METGKIIASLRDKKGLSQTELADKSGVSRVMIGKYERGEAMPSIDAAKKLLMLWKRLRTTSSEKGLILNLTGRLSSDSKIWNTWKMI
jgi:transcriptional regulator with XRE-family HTH domain